MHSHLMTPLDRRELLKRGLVVLSVGATPAILAACGGDNGNGNGEAGGTAPATPTETGGGVPEASGTIDFLSWEGYDIPDATAAWREENGVEFQSTYIGNHDDIQARITAGGGSFDLITYYQGYKPLYAELGILQPIDIERIPNIGNQFPYFQSDVGNFWIDPDGAWTGVPWTWGSIGITWDDAELPGGLTSWYDLLDPELEGRIGLPDDPVGSFTLAAHTLGFDPAAVTQDQKQEIVDLLTQIIGHARSMAPSFGDMTTQLVNGDIVACWQGWAAMNSFAADAGKDTIMTQVPEEGSFSFCDLYAVPTTADNVDTVYAYLNNVLEPEVNAEAAEFLVGGVTVEAAVEFLDEGTRSLYPYEDLDGLLERAPFYNNPPVESDEFVTYQEWIDTWQEVKAGA